MISKGYPCGIEHLQEKIPDQPMGLLHLIKEEDSFSMFSQYPFQASRVSGFIAKEELHTIEVLEL